MKNEITVIQRSDIYNIYSAVIDVSWAVPEWLSPPYLGSFKINLEYTKQQILLQITECLLDVRSPIVIVLMLPLLLQSF